MKLSESPPCLDPVLESNSKEQFLIVLKNQTQKKNCTEKADQDPRYRLLSNYSFKEERISSVGIFYSPDEFSDQPQNFAGIIDIDPGQDGL